jgi:outer membrane protein
MLLLSAFALAATTLGAQERPSLTLEDAIAIARERNPEYLQSRASIRARGLDVRSMWGAFLPSLSTSVQWNASSRTQLTGTDDFGQTVSLPEPITFRSSSASQSISSTLTLFDGLQNVNNLRAAREDVVAADAAADDQVLNIKLQVSQQFYSALLAERLVEVEEQLLSSARERLDANQRMFRVAAVTQVDVLGAEGDVARQEQAVEQQRAEARKARLQVLQILGVLGEIEDFDLVGDFPVIFDPAALDADTLVSRALDANPVIRQQNAAALAADRRASAAKGSWLPRASFNGSFSRGLGQRDYGAFFNLNPKDDRGWGFGLSLQWEIFNGFGRSQRIGQANVAHDQAMEALRAAELQVEQNVRAASIDLETAYESLRLQERLTEISRQRLEMAQEQFRTGSTQMPFTTLQTIIDAAANQERALVQARSTFAVNLVTLERRVGAPIRP